MKRSAALKAAKSGRVSIGLRTGTRDMIAAWWVDRLGRSLQDLVVFLGEIHGVGVDLYLLLRKTWPLCNARNTRHT
jgi:DNA invertase Pin-like site-specific DNA recombinase